jgi:hypothetical protein
MACSRVISTVKILHKVFQRVNAAHTCNIGMSYRIPTEVSTIAGRVFMSFLIFSLMFPGLIDRFYSSLMSQWLKIAS